MRGNAHFGSHGHLGVNACAPGQRIVCRLAVRTVIFYACVGYADVEHHPSRDFSSEVLH